jgi:hypothetical protein
MRAAPIARRISRLPFPGDPIILRVYLTPALESSIMARMFSGRHNYGIAQRRVRA